MSREMNDPLAEFDRRLRADLSITPSPEFEARVRQRIDERPARRWTWMRSYAWLSAAAAVVVVAGALALLNRDTPANPLHPEIPAPAPAVNPPAPVRQVASAAPRRALPVRVPAVRREPEVLVPPQLEAIRRLAQEGIQVQAEPVQKMAGVPDPLEVQPLVVEPIPVPGTPSSSGGMNPVERGR